MNNAPHLSCSDETVKATTLGIAISADIPTLGGKPNRRARNHHSLWLYKVFSVALRARVFAVSLKQKHRPLQN